MTIPTEPIGSPCGHQPRLWEAGILVGVVRRQGDQPAAAANMRPERVGYRVDDGPVDVRAGGGGWYDISPRQAE